MFVSSSVQDSSLGPEIFGHLGDENLSIVIFCNYFIRTLSCNMYLDYVRFDGEIIIFVCFLVEIPFWLLNLLITNITPSLHFF
jgi:hypothetical protein